jgi:HSP20 family protein
MAEQTRSMTRSGNVPPGTQLARRQGRWDPFSLLDELEQDMARFWGRPVTGWPRFMGQMRWAPRMDVYEKDNQLIVETELPGMKKEDVQVDLEGSDLVIHGESRQQREIKDEDYYRTERSYGSFHRRIPLPFEVDPSQIQASMNNGILEVRIPKPAETRSEPRRIQVK